MRDPVSMPAAAEADSESHGMSHVPAAEPSPVVTNTDLRKPRQSPSATAIMVAMLTADGGARTSRCTIDQARPLSSDPGASYETIAAIWSEWCDSKRKSLERPPTVLDEAWNMDPADGQPSRFSASNFHSVRRLVAPGASIAPCQCQCVLVCLAPAYKLHRTRGRRAQKRARLSTAVRTPRSTRRSMRRPAAPSSPRTSRGKTADRRPQAAKDPEYPKVERHVRAHARIVSTCGGTGIAVGW